MPRILMIEDDPHISDVVAFLMEEEGHRVDRATDGRLGWEMYQKGRYALVILDLGLPGIPGWELFAKIRALQADQGLIMLTAQGEEPERVRGLNLGADDYIAKPFSNAELKARVRNLLRRCSPLPEIMRCGPLVLLPESGELNVYGQAVALPMHEFRLLQCLMQRPGRIYSREQLLEAMYGPDTEITDRAVDQSVTRLRRKLRHFLQNRNPIETEYGLGYRMAVLKDADNELPNG